MQKNNAAKDLKRCIIRSMMTGCILQAAVKACLCSKQQGRIRKAAACPKSEGEYVKSPKKARVTYV